MKSSHLLNQRFDHNQLMTELFRTIASEHWIPHFNTGYYSGTWKGIALVGTKSEGRNLAPDKQKKANPALLLEPQRLDYTLKVLDGFEAKVISARYLNLQPGSTIKEHKDPDLDFWGGIVRLHIPLQTNASTSFIIDGKTIYMAEGECWFADFSKAHSVTNAGSHDRIHLVVDLEVNEKIKDRFIKEGIIELDEKEPDPISLMTEEERLSMIRSLEEMGTKTANRILEDLKNTHN